MRNLIIGSNQKLHVQSVKKRKKKEKNTVINSNTIYRGEMKLVSINMDYCLVQFDALKFFLGVHLHGGRGGMSLPNFNFFNLNPQI